MARGCSLLELTVVVPGWSVCVTISIAGIRFLFSTSIFKKEKYAKIGSISLTLPLSESFLSEVWDLVHLVLVRATAGGSRSPSLLSLVGEEV